MSEIKVFNKYPSAGVKIDDPGLRQYLNLKPIIVPCTFGRQAYKKFGKSNVHIVERLIQKLQNPGHKGKKHWRTSKFCSGKSSTHVRIVEASFHIIEQKLHQNPIEVLVKAVQNTAPREEVTVIEMGGIRVPKQVDTAPQRRVDMSLRWIVQGTFQSTAAKKITIEQGLADEIMNAAMNDSKSFAVSKCGETERQAGASK
ncbi:MAG: 30S ribosomal protein S7 [Candidatus Nanoarchaeia archaeon]|nr:30S ribosomal protein S7 [Candidatus Nanoarchaeia archaeon]